MSYNLQDMDNFIIIIVGFFHIQMMRLNLIFKKMYKLVCGQVDN